MLADDKKLSFLQDHFYQVLVESSSQNMEGPLQVLLQGKGLSVCEYSVFVVYCTED